MRKLVIRDQDGKVINIGEWDYLLAPKPMIAKGGEDLGAIYDDRGRYCGRRLAAAGEHIGIETDADGNVIYIQTNPLPAGATQAEEECVVGWDGGIYAAGDPRAVRA